MLGDLGKLIVAKGFKSCPKSKKSPDLVTLLAERSLPIPEVSRSNPKIIIKLFSVNS